MSWTFDLPAGTFKNHALSSNIRREAVAKVQTMKFFTPEPGYGKHKGESITITRFLQLPIGSRVSEIEKLPSGRPVVETKQVTVGEWGFKIETTQFEKDLTFFDLTNQFQMLLRDQMSITMDKMAADALKLTPIKYVPTAVGATLTTNGVAGALSDRNLEVQDLRRIHDYLADDLKAPTRKNGRYVGILSVNAARGIKNDPEYKDWQAPTTSSPFISGELKSIEGFDLYETNHVAAYARLVGSSLVTGEAVFFGEDAGRLLTIRDPELRAGIPEDLGRFQEVGWVGAIEAFGPWNDRASVARTVHVTST